MFVPADQLAVVKIDKAKPDHLLLCPGSEMVLFWIADNGGSPLAVFLNGPHARHAFPASKGANWKGVLIGPVEIRVDVTSAHMGNKETGGDLQAHDGKLTMAVAVREAGYPGTGSLLIRTLETPEQERLYFSRWSIGMTQDEEWLELVKFDGNSITGALIPGKAATVELSGV